MREPALFKAIRAKGPAEQGAPGEQQDTRAAHRCLKRCEQAPRRLAAGTASLTADSEASAAGRRKSNGSVQRIHGKVPQELSTHRCVRGLRLSPQYCCRAAPLPQSLPRHLAPCRKVDGAGLREGISAPATQGAAGGAREAHTVTTGARAHTDRSARSPGWAKHRAAEEVSRNSTDA